MLWDYHKFSLGSFALIAARLASTEFSVANPIGDRHLGVAISVVIFFGNYPIFSTTKLVVGNSTTWLPYKNGFYGHFLLRSTLTIVSLHWVVFRNLQNSLVVLT